MYAVEPICITRYSSYQRISTLCTIRLNTRGKMGLPQCRSTITTHSFVVTQRCQNGRPMSKAKPCNCGHSKQEHKWRFFYPRSSSEGRTFCYACLPTGKMDKWVRFYEKHKACHGYEYVNAIPFNTDCMCGHARKQHRGQCFEVVYADQTNNPGQYYCKCSKYKADLLKYLEWKSAQPAKH